MGETQDEVVVVTADDAGEPVSFLRCGDVYLVVGPPQRFYRRRGAWWRRPAIIDRLDVEVWRVEAARAGEQASAFDLRHEHPAWYLERVWRP